MCVRLNTPSGDAEEATLGKSDDADAAEAANGEDASTGDAAANGEDASTDDEATTSVACEAPRRAVLGRDDEAPRIMQRTVREPAAESRCMEGGPLVKSSRGDADPCLT